MKGVEIKKPEQLKTMASLIIPGGESTTMAKLAENHNLLIQNLQHPTETQNQVRATARLSNVLQFTRMGYSEEQMNRAISEVLETSHNKEISSVLCLLREDEVYGFHMKSQSIRGILRATPSTHTLVNGDDRDCVES